MNGWDALFVAVGGGLGAMSRYAVSKLIARLFQSPFPYGTLTVNLIGSFVLGAVFAGGMEGVWNHFIAVGLLSSFTTFSTFHIEGLQLFRQKQYKVVVLYFLLTYPGTILFVYLGYSFYFI